jgi:hypothetical protein
MALAILEFESEDSGNYRFKFDIGTNSFYKFKIGRSTEERAEMNWVTDISKSTPFKKRKKDFIGGDTSEEALLPTKYFDRENCYVQLLSAKDEHGRSPAVSQIIKIPYGFRNIDSDNFGLPPGAGKNMNDINFNPARRISHAQHELSYQYSLEELLGPLLRAALPIALGAITQATGAAAGGSTGAAGGGASGSSGMGSLTSILTTLLRALAPAPGAGPAVSHASSLMQPELMDGNRFGSFRSNRQVTMTRPMVFGIDDALLASLAGPVIQEGIQLLPQLLNSINQHKLQTLQANNQLMTTLAGDVQRRLMMQQLMQNQGAAAGGSAANIDPAVLAQLIAQIQAQQPAAPAAPAGTTPAAAAPPVAGAHSFSLNGNGTSYTMSGNVLLTFESLEMQKFAGKDTLILQKADKVIFRIKLNVASNPKKPLPKAIYNFYFKDPLTKQVYGTKTFRKKDVEANSVIDFEFAKTELGNIPLQKAVEIFVEMRWLAADHEYKAVSTCPAVFVEKFFYQSQGGAVSQEKELNDMKIYRSFWNKIWQSRAIGKSKSVWELCIDAKYTVTLSPDHLSNGTTETKFAVDPKDKESLSDVTTGKMKAGIELSLTEVNKLMDGWEGAKPLDEDTLDALRCSDFARTNAAELVCNVKLKGRSYENGVFWAIPVFKMYEITLGKVESVNDYGYVKYISATKVRFPLPVSVRILGLKSKNSE